MEVLLPIGATAYAVVGLSLLLYRRMRNARMSAAHARLGMFAGIASIALSALCGGMALLAMR